MLRLVHPAPKGQISSCRTRRYSAVLTPTLDEQNRVRAAAKNLARAYGGRDVLASVMGVPLGTIKNLCRGVSYAIAILVARAANIPVEQLLSGKPHEAGACPLCYRKGPR